MFFIVTSITSLMISLCRTVAFKSSKFWIYKIDYLFSLTIGVFVVTVIICIEKYPKLLSSIVTQRQRARQYRRKEGHRFGPRSQFFP